MYWLNLKTRPTCFGDNKHFPGKATGYQFRTALYRRAMFERTVDRIAEQVQHRTWISRAFNAVARVFGRNR